MTMTEGTVNRPSDGVEPEKSESAQKETRLLLGLTLQPSKPVSQLMLFLGGIFYIGLLLINAVAVLSEDRFLARSACLFVVPPASHL